MKKKLTKRQIIHISTGLIIALTFAILFWPRKELSGKHVGWKKIPFEYIYWAKLKQLADMRLLELSNRSDWNEIKKMPDWEKEKIETSYDAILVEVKTNYGELELDLNTVDQELLNIAYQNRSRMNFESNYFAALIEVKNSSLFKSFRIDCATELMIVKPCSKRTIAMLWQTPYTEKECFNTYLYGYGHTSDMVYAFDRFLEDKTELSLPQFVFNDEVESSLVKLLNFPYSEVRRDAKQNEGLAQ